MVTYTAPGMAETQRRFSEKPYKIFNAMFWIGIALIVAVIVWMTVAVVLGGEAEEIYDEYSTGATIAAAAVFALGLVFRLTIKKNIKNAAKQDYVDTYRLEEHFMVVTTTRSGEQIGESKFYYRDLVKVKNGKKFIALYPNAATAFVIFKDGLSAEELREVETNLNNRIIDK